MNSGNAVGTVRADDRKVCHTNLPYRPLFNKADALDAAFVTWESYSYFIEQPTINLVNDFELPWEKTLKPPCRPLLQGLGQQGMIGISQSFPGQLPSLVPSEVRVVDQDSHQLRDRHRRMGVVQLNGGLLRELFPIGIVAQEAPDDIRK